MYTEPVNGLPGYYGSYESKNGSVKTLQAALQGIKQVWILLIEETLDGPLVHICEVMLHPLYSILGV